VTIKDEIRLVWDTNGIPDHCIEDSLLIKYNVSKLELLQIYREIQEERCL